MPTTKEEKKVNISININPRQYRDHRLRDRSRRYSGLFLRVQPERRDNLLPHLLLHLHLHQRPRCPDPVRLPQQINPAPKHDRSPVLRQRVHRLMRAFLLLHQLPQWLRGLLHRLHPLLFPLRPGVSLHCAEGPAKRSSEEEWPKFNFLRQPEKCNNLLIQMTFISEPS